MPLAALNRLSLDDYRREMKLGPVEAARRLDGWRGTGSQRVDPVSPPGPAATASKAKPIKAGAGGSNKYGAKRTAGPGGRVYDSKAEAAMAQRLEDERLTGGIVSWIPQVSLPCGVDEKGRDVRYRADALVVLEVRADGTFIGKLMDKKGMDTPTSRAKRAALRSLYGIDTQVIA